MRLSNLADARSVPRTYGSDIDQRLRRAEMETKSGSITRESVEVVRRFVEALARENLARGNVEAALEFCDPDVEVEESPRWPDRRTYRGHEGAMQAYQTMLEAFEDLRFEIEDFIEVGDQVVMCLKVYGRGKESGVETDARIAHLYTVEGEKITRLRVYDDRDEAQQAAEREAELQGEHQGGILRVAPRGSKEA
jgi:ketosteroid isomerase-like protein